MMKIAEESITRIPILRYEGRQNVDFAAWRKSFTTSMGRRYSELVQVYRTGVAFTYKAPTELDAAVVSGNTSSDAMQRAMFMEQMAEHREANLMLNKTNIQLYSELYNKLHEDVYKNLLTILYGRK